MGKKRFQILLVEDNPADVAMIREALKHHKVECDLNVVRDGEKALVVIEGIDAGDETTSLDLLIVDMHLPRHDGNDILNRLRATREGRLIPVVAMSGQFDPHFAAQERLVCFTKPSTVDEFLRIGAIVSGLLPQGSRAAAGNPEDGL